MSTPTIVNLAPTLFCIVLAGYSAWPYIGLGEPPREKPEAGSSLEVPETMLSPTIGTPHDRDPYRDPEEFRAEAASKLAGILNGWMRTTFPPRDALGERTSHATGPARGTATPHGSAAAKGGDRTGPVPSADDPRGEMKLKLTFVQGKNRIAMIDDRIYETGEAIRGLSSERGPCFVAEILHHEVILNYQGRRLSLRYPELQGSSSGHRAATAPAPVAGRGAVAGRKPASLPPGGQSAVRRRD